MGRDSSKTLGLCDSARFVVREQLGETVGSCRPCQSRGPSQELHLPRLRCHVFHALIGQLRDVKESFRSWKNSNKRTSRNLHNLTEVDSTLFRFFRVHESAE